MLPAKGFLTLCTQYICTPPALRPNICSSGHYTIMAWFWTCGLNALHTHIYFGACNGASVVLTTCMNFLPRTMAADLCQPHAQYCSHPSCSSGGHWSARYWTSPAQLTTVSSTMEFHCAEPASRISFSALC